MTNTTISYPLTDQITLKNGESILSPQDEIKFQEYLIKNKNFTIVAKSKGKCVTHHLPLYFGTTEEDFNPHRKMAIRLKRLHKDPKYNTPESLQITQTKKRMIRPKFETGKVILNDEVKSLNVDLQLDSNNNNDNNSNDIENVKNLNNITPKVTSNSTFVSSATIDPSTPLQSATSQSPSLALASVPISTENPSQSQSQSPILAPVSTSTSASTSTSTPNATLTTKPVSTPISFAAAAAALKPKKPSSASLSASPHIKSTPKSSTNVTTNASSVSPSIPDSVSPALMDNTLKPLGIILLRIMYDSQYLSSVITNKKQNLIIPHGLSNTGNICYMNSVLQFLFSCEPFTQVLNIIRDNTVANIGSTNNPILDALLNMLDMLKKKPSSTSVNKSFEVVNPVGFHNAIASLPRFRHLKWGRQEDAEEFLGYLLDGLHEEFVDSISKLSTSDVNKFANAFNSKEVSRKIIQAVEFIKESGKDTGSSDNNDGWKEVGSNRKVADKRTFEVKPSPIVKLFGGQFKSVLKAANKKSSITLDPFMQVQLDISDPETNDLITAFEKFSEDEEISLGNQMAKKQNFIDKLPSILIIHLKRFSFVTSEETESEQTGYEVISKSKKKKNAKEAQLIQQQPQQSQQLPKAKIFEGRIEKIHKFINYGHNITLPKSCISNMITEVPSYKLTGVVYHHGRSTENGHYTVDVLSSSDDWIRIDDTNITGVSNDEVVSDQNLNNNAQTNKSAYILMYQKI